MLAFLVAALAVAGLPDAAACASGVSIRAGNSMGAGVVWSTPARTVLTTLHLVESAPGDVVVMLPGGGAHLARVVDREPALDLALLEVEGDTALAAGPTPGAAYALAPGDPVSLPGCGAPERPTERGTVVAASRGFAGAIYLAIRAEVAPGWSGRPVIDERGALVGIVDLALVREPGTALAIPVERATARFPRG